MGRLFLKTLTVVAMGSSLWFSGVLASVPDLKPRWAAASANPYGVSNDSYLDYWVIFSEQDSGSCRSDEVSLQSDSGLLGVNLNEQLLEPRQARAIRQKYESIHRDFEMRSQYGLVDFEEEQAQINQINQFARDVLEVVRQKQKRFGGQTLRKVVRGVSDLKKFSQSLAVAGTLVATYSGLPFNLELSDDFRMSGWTSLREQVGQLSLSSPVVNSSFKISRLAPTGPNSDGQERFRFGVSRGLPVLDISSGLTYGSSSNSLTASLSKPLTESLVCVLDSVRPISASAPGARSPEDTIRLLYGIQF
jgi:hypothetical protein